MSFLSVSVFAHPGDEKPMNTIDAGSTINVAMDINIPSDNKLLAQNGKLFSFYGPINGSTPFCSFAATDANFDDLGRDSVLKAGTQLTAFEVRGSKVWGDGAVVIRFKSSSGNVLHINCATNYDTKNHDIYGTPSIGQFRAAVRNFVTLNLAPPVEL